MTCRPVQLPGGGTAILCGPKSKRDVECLYCRQPATHLCDAPVKRTIKGWDFPNATCDVPMCARCTAPGPNNTDFCRSHKPVPLDSRALGDLDLMK